VSVNGVFLIDKPVGPTSHDVVDVLRRVAGEKTIGHAGTLDPLASGLLLVGIGREFTKRLDRFRGLPKVYEATVTLGSESSTYDREGELTAVSDRQPGGEEVERALRQLGESREQLPPIFSAKKIQGTSAHRLARQGKTVELRPSAIEIYSIKLVDYRYPQVSFTAKVSAGTYIRSLAHDIGKLLNIGAYLSALRRTQIGDFSVDRAVGLDEIRSLADLEKARINGVL
jgi:tRNA pseudouridine55 synthase